MKRSLINTTDLSLQINIVYFEKKLAMDLLVFLSIFTLFDHGKDEKTILIK